MYDTQNIRRVSYSASFEHVQLFGYAIKQLFKKLLYTELQESDALLTVLKSLLPGEIEKLEQRTDSGSASVDHDNYLYLLRPFFDKLSIDADKPLGTSKGKLLEEIVRELVLNATNPSYEIFNYQPQPTIFIIDDAQYIDKESWQYLHLLGSAPTSLVVMAMRDPTLNDDELHGRMVTLRDASTTKHIHLTGLCGIWMSLGEPSNVFFSPSIGLENRYLTTLACQAMFVQRIPKDLEQLITRKSDKFVVNEDVERQSESNSSFARVTEVIHRMSFNCSRISWPIKSFASRRSMMTISTRSTSKDFRSICGSVSHSTILQQAISKFSSNTSNLKCVASVTWIGINSGHIPQSSRTSTLMSKLTN